MNIHQNSVVKLEYTLTSAGEVQPSTVQTVLMSHAHSLPAGLEPHLLGHAAGDTFELDLTLLVDESLKSTVPLESLPQGIGVGETVRGEDISGVALAYRVAALEGEHAFLDANPERAGLEVRTRVSILSVREAEPTELEHGHVHGEGGVKHAH